MSEQQDRSLKAAFASAKLHQKDIESLDPRSDTAKEAVRSTITDLEQCQKLLQTASIFSRNEDLEDITTESLQYLTVEYLLAELLLRTYDSDRLAALRRSSQLLEAFLERLDHYGMLSKSDTELYERYTESRASFSLLATSNLEDKRRLKVARFQQEKALKQKLEYVRTQSQSLNVDDETKRDLYLAEIAFDVHQAFQSLDMISQETAILAQTQSQPVRLNGHAPDTRSPQRSDGYSERLDGPGTMAGLGHRGGPLLDGKGKPMQPFTILDKRSEMRQGVFRSGHNLPTMSIDEYLEEERKRGGIIDGGGNSGEAQPETDEDDLSQVDAATMKAREWDEFVEANPKGAGNTLNRG